MNYTRICHDGLPTKYNFTKWTVLGGKMAPINGIVIGLDSTNM